MKSASKEIKIMFTNNLYFLFQQSESHRFKTSFKIKRIGLASFIIHSMFHHIEFLHVYKSIRELKLARNSVTMTPKNMTSADIDRQ